MPSKKAAATPVSSRLLQPTASHAARQNAATTASTHTARNLHSSERRREQANFISAVVKSVAPAVGALAAAATESAAPDATRPIAPAAAAAAPALAQGVDGAASADTAAVVAATAADSSFVKSKKQVKLPPLPMAMLVPSLADSVKLPRALQENVLAAATTPNLPTAAAAAAASSKSSKRLAATAHLRLSLTSGSSSSLSSGERPSPRRIPTTTAALAAATAPAAVAALSFSPRFLMSTGNRRQYHRATEDTDDLGDVVVPVPSPWTRGWISRRIRPTVHAMNVYAADNLNNADRALRGGAANSDSYAASICDGEERSMFVVRRFDNLATLENSILLDINMDANSKCVSARRPLPPSVSSLEAAPAPRRGFVVGGGGGGGGGSFGGGTFAFTGAGPMSESAIAGGGLASLAAPDVKNEARERRLEAQRQEHAAGNAYVEFIFGSASPPGAASERLLQEQLDALIRKAKTMSVHSSFRAPQSAGRSGGRKVASTVAFGDIDAPHFDDEEPVAM